MHAAAGRAHHARPENRSFLTIAWTPQLPSTTWVTPKSTPIDISDLQGPVSAVPVTISLGVAAMEPTQAGRFGSTALLVRAADRALYAAKQSGRNCVRVFSAKAPAAAA